MTEAEWLASHNPVGELWRLWQQRSVTERQVRLFACGCCRIHWASLSKALYRDAVELCEKYADGLATQSELLATRIAIEIGGPPDFRDDPFGVCCYGVIGRELNAVISAVWSLTHSTRFGVLGDEIVGVLRDVVNNPFRPVFADSLWLTSAVAELARTMYESRDFGPMPILADALQEAGYEDADILAHCRGGGPHVRGCWVVDLVLGKS